MSLLPLLTDLLDERRWPTIYDQNFGLGISPVSLMAPSALSVPLRAGYLRPWRHLSASDSGISNIINDKENFTVNLDVQQFKPEEVTVKVVNNYLVVEAKHEERGDEHGYISRHFVRRYKLPEDVDSDAITSTLSSDGVLQLMAPKKVSSEAILMKPVDTGETSQAPVESSSEKTIPIIQTKQPALKLQEGEAKQENMES